MKNSNWSLYAPNFLLIYDAVGVDSEKMMRWKCSSFFTNRFTLWRMERKKLILINSCAKAQFSQEIVFVEHRDYFFRIPCVISDQKHPFFNEKKIIFRYFIYFIEFFKLFTYFYYNHLLISNISISPQKDCHPYAQNGCL